MRERYRDFYTQMLTSQLEWRRHNISNQERGKQNGEYYNHVLPAKDWELNLWSGINSQSGHMLPIYIEENRIRKHTGVHNLLSSWVLCANLYFPFRSDAGYEMLAGFLRHLVSPEISSVIGVELEYELPDAALKPGILLGEMDGGRGAGQTSPDVAFLIKTEHGEGVILVECKFTEHNFYGCSGRNSNPRNGKPNLDLNRCVDPIAVLDDPHKQCHLYQWGRKYWDHLKPAANRRALSKLKACPAAFGGYQLFRQQALAEGIAQSGKFALVVSAVVYDERNAGLVLSLNRSTGISDIRNDWSQIFAGKAGFSSFTHQAWVSWVKEHDHQEHWREWLEYITKRYSL